MLFGAHISIAGGIESSPRKAHKLGCECFQFFSRSPQGGRALSLDKKTIKNFKQDCAKYNFKYYYIHSPYYINLASGKSNIYYGSIKVLREELERGSQLGAKYVMTHIGSAKDLGEKKAIIKIVDAIKKILNNYKGSTQFLIEISAGAGGIIGSTFEEIGKILKKFPESKNKSKNIGVCFDTAHAFASGYDLRTQKGIDDTLKDFNKFIGLNRLKLSHINDSKVNLGEKKDRHEHIGKGKIGIDGFRQLLKDPRLQDINFILETPRDKHGDYKSNLAILKKIRNTIK